MSADISDRERFAFFMRERQMLLEQIRKHHERAARLVADNDELRARIRELEQFK